MSKNKKSNNYLITRARYKSIKAFDHQQMEQFCTDIPGTRRKRSGLQVLCLRLCLQGTGHGRNQGRVHIVLG